MQVTGAGAKENGKSGARRSRLYSTKIDIEKLGVGKTLGGNRGAGSGNGRPGRPSRESLKQAAGEAAPKR